MIYGLEDDYYCVHTPIPVEVGWESPNEWASLQIFSGTTPLLDREPIMYKGVNDRYKIDLSKWVRYLLPSMEDYVQYTVSEQVFTKTGRSEFNIIFTNNNEDTLTASGKIFFHCADEDGLYSTEGITLKAWKGYPFSWDSVGDYEEFYTQVLNDINEDLQSDFDVEFITDDCKGVYIRWLNEKGTYNYWMFKHTKFVERSGDEYFRTPRNIFNADKSSNEDTAGFELEEKISVKSIVDKKYYHLFKSIVGSPCVYMLKPDYVPGSTVNPDDWIKIIQDDVSFERDYLSRNTAELEFDFSLPKPYTQTRL